MLVVIFILLVPCHTYCNEILISSYNDKHGLVTCITSVLEKYFKGEKELTFVDINSDDTNIITAVNKQTLWSIVSRKPSQKIRIPNQGYLINAGDAKDFIENFSYLNQEGNWNPYARFVIVIDDLDEKALENVFKELLDAYVYNVIVVNGTNQADIYTYNPYENYACGRHFDRIISYGQCAITETCDYFPNKLVTGLRNCTIHMAAPHIPPLAYQPHLCDLKKKIFCLGTEQYVLKLLSEIEHFKVNYTYNDFAEDVVDKDVNIGAFGMIRNKQVDGLLGFYLLTDTRSETFSYYYKYAAYTDELIYIVKKAGETQKWKYIYIEFSATVWALLFICFFISSAMVICLSKPRDKAAVFLKMFDSLFLHGFSVRRKLSVRLFLTVWIWFAYLTNAFYQSSLMSLTTDPSKEYQVSTEEDLVAYKFKPCVLTTVRTFFSAYVDMKFEGDTGECKQLVQALEKISETDGIYTIGPLSSFKYHQHMFYNARGELPLYYFRKPVLKVIYATFFYKGFPLKDKLEMHAMHIREAGMSRAHTLRVYYESMMTNLHVFDTSFRTHMVVPWELLVISYAVAMVVFILEVLGKNRK